MADTAWAALLARLYLHDWVVYAKHSLGGPQQVLDYLGRYTHRVAISNERILDIGADTVSVRVRDWTQGNRRRTLKLPAAELHRALLAARATQGLQAYPPLRPARRRRARRLRRQHPIRSWWNRFSPSCTASSVTSTCVARIVAKASSCPPRALRLCRCACCICGDCREIPLALAIGVLCSWRWTMPGERTALWPGSRDTGFCSRLFAHFATSNWPYQCSRALPLATSSS